MIWRLAWFGILTAGCLGATSIGFAGIACAQDVAAKVRASMAFLKSEAEKMGTPKLEGIEKLAGKDVPILHFGSIKMNNNVALVDEVERRMGRATITIFVKSGDWFVSVATSVQHRDGSRPTGEELVLASGPSANRALAAIRAIRANQAFYGEIFGLGLGWEAGYQPIRDAANNVVGLYYIGIVTGLL